MTRGKIVDAYWDQVSNQIVKPLTDDLQEKLSPGGRFIVFYCDLRTGEVVADAIKVSVTPRCKGEGVSNCLITKLFRKKTCITCLGFHRGVKTYNMCVLCMKMIMF